MKLIGYQLPAMSSLLLWGMLWEIVGQLEMTFFVPALSEIFITLSEIFTTKPFIKALTETGQAYFLGVFFAVSIGVPVGILMGTPNRKEKRSPKNIFRMLDWVDLSRSSLTSFPAA